VRFSQSQQLPILFAAESRVGLIFMTAVGEQEFDLPGDTLIEEQFHFKVAVKLAEPCATSPSLLLQVVAHSDSSFGG
jgi:hypothetical protein